MTIYYCVLYIVCSYRRRAASPGILRPVHTQPEDLRDRRGVPPHRDHQRPGLRGDLRALCLPASKYCKAPIRSANASSALSCMGRACNLRGIILSYAHANSQPAPSSVPEKTCTCLMFSYLPLSAASTNLHLQTLHLGIKKSLHAQSQHHSVPCTRARASQTARLRNLAS